MIDKEKETSKKKGQNLILELLHVLNFAQSLFEEFLFGKSEFIYNEFYNTEENVNEVNEQFDNEESSDETEHNEIEKSLRRCAYGAYLSSLAPRHTKTIQCKYYTLVIYFLKELIILDTVWTASFTLPSRKTAYNSVFKVEVGDTFCF